MNNPSLSADVPRVLYHHRTQGKAVEGVHIRGITDALRAEGVAVDIISLPGADPYATPKSMSPTRQAKWWMRLVTSLPEPLFELAELFYNVVTAVRLVVYLATHRDVAFVYERYSLFLFVTVLLGRMTGTPVILEVNDSAIVERVRPLWFHRLAMAIERWVFQHASGLVFVSGVFRERAVRAHGQLAPSIVSPNAANVDKFTITASQRSESRRHLGVEGDVVCGYLGAFVPWHAIDRFVYEIADALPRYPHLKLLLVGDGATFGRVKAFVADRGLQDRILLTGRVAHDEVPSLLAAMDMAVLPSAGDYTSPVKLFEFMASGIPPVAPDFSPIMEVLTPGATGWTFPAGDVAAAVEEVLKRSEDVQTLRAVGAAARSYVAEHRQWRHNVHQLVDLYRTLQPAAQPA